MKKILPVIAILALASCGQNNETKQAELAKMKTDSTHKADSIKLASSKFTAPKDWQKIDQASYSIQYPSTWTLDQSSQSGVIFTCKSPLETPADNFQENVNMTTEDLTGRSMDLDAYSKASLEQIKSYFKDVAMIENKKVDDGFGGHEQIIYTASMDTMHLQVEQWYWIIK
ncbi:MAG TPA: hypothetical protein VN922_24190, partial [Bacteroidia bacterium]|nr:hypothetical protein [Bacteroidia bacterium]